MSHKKPGIVKTALYRNIAISFIVLSVAIAATIFYVTFSWTTVIITPQKLQLSDSFSIVATANPISGSQDSLKARVLRLPLSGDGTFNPSKQESVKRKSRGVVTIVNTSTKNQPLRATTRLLTKDNVLFRIQKFVDVPAGGAVEVAVQADQEGAVRTDMSRLTIPGLWVGLQDKIYAKDFREEQSGEGLIASVTQEDIDRAKGELSKKLEQKLQLLADIPDAAFQPKKAVKLLNLASIEATASHKPGDETDAFSVSVKALGTAVVFDESDMLSLVRNRIQQQLGIGYEFVFTDEDTLSYTVESFNEKQNEAQVSVSVQAGKVRTEDTTQINRKNLVGLSKAQIKEYFASYGDIGSVTVNFYPFWVQRAPLLTDHIHILFQK